DGATKPEPRQNEPAQQAGKPGLADPRAVENASNYTFATATNASFTDMSSGTTQIVGPAADDTASTLQNIGFDFYFLGTRFSTFSASSNGFVRLGGVVSTTQYTLGTAGVSLIAAYGSDNFVSTTGKVHYKVTGSAPNRILTVEFLNETIIYDGAGATADGTDQVRLYESTGVIELVYGAMNRNASTGFMGGMEPQYVGFSNNNTANTFATVNTSTNVVNTTGALVSNQPTLNAAIPNINTPVNGSRRIYSFTPNVPTAPTALNFTGVTPLAMTLNWTDSPDETLYAVYKSTDGVNFNFETTLAANSVSYAAPGLSPSTTYFWRVFAVSDGALSTALAGSQATGAGGAISSTAAGGLWSQTTTWVGGNVPSNTDNVTIANGATVTVDTAAVALSLTVGAGGAAAILQFDSAVARTLTVGTSVSIASNGTLQSATAGTVTTHVLSLGTNLVNSGVLDLSTNANTAGANLTFTGPTNNTWSGTGATNDIRTVTINKGTSNANVLELTATNFTAQGVGTDGANAAFLTLTNGTFKVSGTFVASFRTFTAAAYTIGATAGFWLNNPNYSVAGQNGSPTESGLLRISQGTFNIGTSSGNSMGFSTGSTVIVEGGAVNATGRFGVSAAGNAFTYTQTAGTITVCTVGNASATLGSFDLGTSLSSVITMSSGTIVCQLAATAIDYRNQAGGGIANVTGGILQMGNAGSGAAKAFNLRGVLPNLVITNTSANHSATMSTTLVNFNNISLNITINTGTTFDAGNVVFLFNGTTLTNNGTLTHNGASSNFVWFLTTAPQTYTGSGVVTAPITNFAIQADMGLTINPASSNIVCSAVRLFSGSVTNSNKITVGNGGATTGTVQIGNTTTPTAAGTFDVPMTFNLGTGGQVMSYLRTTASRTTGGEINPTRSLTTFTYDDNDANHTLTIAGGNITTTGTSNFTNGRIITGANTYAVGGAGTVTRTNGYVDGNLRKTYTAAANKTFEVGTANAFSPVAVNITAGTFPADFTAKAVQGPQPNIGSPSHALQRYWTLTGTGVTADLTFTYAADAIDAPPPAQEGFFIILKYNGAFSAPGGVVNTGANTASITGVTSFSDWTLAEPNAPTAIVLASAKAIEYDSGTYLQWTTGAEVRNLGFNIYRDEGGKRTLVNPQLIAGGALLAGSDTLLRSGKSYSWWISSASGKSPAQYWLEDVDLSGLSTWHGPIGATRIGGKPMATSDAAVLSQVGVAEAQAGSSNQVTRSAALTRVSGGQVKLQSDLAGKQAVKITVRREGWYRVTQADLIAAGFNAKTDPQMLQMYVDGRQIPISVITNEKQISAVDFYGRGIDASYTDARVYWLVAGTQPGLRMPQVKVEGYPTASRSFLYTAERKDRTIYFSSLRNGDKENFFGPVIAREPVDQTLNLQHVDQTAGADGQLELSLQGVTQLPHRVWAYLNGTFVGELAFNGQAEGLAKLPVAHSLLREGDNQVRIVAQGGTSDVSLVNWVRLGYFHDFKADNNALRFTATGGQAVTVSGFGSPAIRVLDVTDPDSVREVLGKVQQNDDGYSITVASPQSGERTLVAALDDERLNPARVADNQPSNLRSSEHAANLVIIANRDTISSVEPLRAQRASQGFRVEVLNVEDIFDEFSFGNKSPQAMRDFLLFTQAGWKVAPQYVLLVGDASLDPKGYLGLPDSDLVPTMLIDTALLETASDDRLGDLDGDGIPELAMGRLPVRTGDEAARMIQKIIGYDRSNPSGSVMLVADGNDGYDFESATLNLAALVPASLKVDVLNRGQMDLTLARAALLDAINRGQKVINYIGHGSVNVWRAGLLTNEDAAAMVNGRLPLFVMMTCLNGYFQDPGLDSLAESLMKSRGGSIAVLASSGMTDPDGQTAINRQMFQLLFRMSNLKGQPLTLGEAMLRAKREVGDIDVRRTFTLFGDPTTRLR
ncbi:MAG TPA: C25 family cysteine peptidase, partial [Blastocatellia bacterium]|nr:C25 family cysteine peptidase [Blastocatellia bacterium]